MLVQFRWFNQFWTFQHQLIAAPGDDLRRGAYYQSLTIDAGTAKEVRIFGFGGWALDRYEHLWRQGLADVWRRRWQMNGEAVLSISVTVVAQAITLAYVGFAVRRGEYSFSEGVIAAQATVALSATAGTAFRAWRFGSRAAAELEHLLDTGQPRTIRSKLHRRPSSPPGIRFEGVSFAYPAKPTALVLQDVDLHIRPGSLTAIVGENGAGKSTIFKLLTGEYVPANGRIVVDEGDRAARRDWGDDRVHAVFQNFMRLPATLLENVTLGSRHALDEAALERAASLSEIDGLVDSLPQGWDTVLSGRVEDGLDLSGGQWQRVAIARALYRATPNDLLLLDEPTSQLDVRGEVRIFERLRSERRGATTVFISHRFGAVRQADEIIVLANGRVVESGDHSSLMAQNGLYASMYGVQAELFASPVPAPAVQT